MSQVTKSEKQILINLIKRNECTNHNSCLFYLDQDNFTYKSLVCPLLNKNCIRHYTPTRSSKQTVIPTKNIRFAAVEIYREKFGMEDLFDNLI